MSVVLAVRSNWGAVDRTLRHLRAQTAAARLEVVLVASADLPGEPMPAAFAPFAGWRVVRVPSMPFSVAHANAVGIRAAQSDIVALAEDHCFPDPGWAEALITAHARACAAVAPVFRNANPATAVSWVDFLLGYGPWMEPAAAGPRPFLPGHNTSYKRSVLLAYGPELDTMLESEASLHVDLCRHGHELHLEPRARVAHVNFALLWVWLPLQFHCGRLFAARRFHLQPRRRALLYGLAAPLIPFVRAWQVAREVSRPGRSQTFSLRMLPVLALGLACDGAGQMIGYLFGAGGSPQKFADLESDRLRFVTDEDRRMLECQSDERSAA